MGKKTNKQTSYPSLTILYCSSSMNAQLEYRSNKDLFSPNDLATLFVTSGWSCMWSPIRTTWLASEQCIGTRVSGSRHMAHSSIMHWKMLHAFLTLLLPATEQVHSTIPRTLPIIILSASFIACDKNLIRFIEFAMVNQRGNSLDVYPSWHLRMIPSIVHSLERIT